ncbi:Fes1-domain-containing protein [Macrolepiota fuliginosa MF-IS2]|uniref:Fes1-domain-containing protein n=1 Tax=Macrolepiota fuliginosa MF-IS2 TaxID=1400762 RepID=A0A9P5XFL9_9AGAR|nr:Fes1-domain-containing protein [Macrolepiota fuliginosa MF-IS2]
MQSILRWSLEHSSPLDSKPNDKPPVSRQQIDPGIIDMILGKPDAVQMKDDIALATDPTKSEDDRLAALDHLEMLVENIDNANDLAALKLWDPLVSLLTSETSSFNIKTQVLWIVGTAVQNNPGAQSEYLSRNPLPILLTFLAPSSALAARSKAIYALSGLLKHNAPAVAALGTPEVNGWPKLREALKDPEFSVQRKIAFLFNTLLTPVQAQYDTDPSVATAPGPELHTVDEQKPNNEIIHETSHAAHLKDPSRSNTSKIARVAFEEHKIIDVVVSALIDSVPHGEDDQAQLDADFQEKALRLLHTYIVICKGHPPDPQRASLRRWLEKDKAWIADSALSSSELSELLQRT